MTRVTDKALQAALEQTKLYVDRETSVMRKDIPTKLSQLNNDNHTVTDAEYVHTDNNFTDADKAVVGSLPATILTNPHVIASGGETYLNVTYDMATLTDGAYSTTTKTVSIPTANPATSRAGLMSVPDKIKLDGIEEGANNYVLPVASASVRAGVVLNTAWQTPTLDSEDADGKNVPFEMANESSSSGILKPACKAYVDNEPTSGSNHLMTSGAVHTAIDKAKMQVFIDLWDRACKYNGTVYGKYAPANAPDPEHPFYLNELWLTYEEALTIFERGVWRFNSMPAIDGTNVKTNLFAMSLCDHFDRANNMGGFDLSRFVRANQRIETLRVSIDDNEAIMSGGAAYGLTVKSINNMFFPGTHNLFKKMFGVIDLKRVVEPWKLCEGTLPNLTTFLLTRVRCSFDISCAPKISLDSINYWITAALNASAITITVHPTVYAKLTDTSNTEWNAVLTAAAAKNISFATTT